MRRANAIDFWRGYALVEIFINHVPDNGLWRLTHRQYSWSDAAEALVFLAGFSIALRMAARPHDLTTFVAGRLAKIYIAHVVVTFILVGIYLVARYRFGDATIFEDYHFSLDSFGVLPMTLGVFLLAEHISYFNILPLYFVLTAVVPLMIALARVSHAALFFASACIYALSQMGVQIDQWPSGRFWAFNPYAWQFVFVLGFLAGARKNEIAQRLDQSRYLVPLAFLVVVASAISMRFGLPAPASPDRGPLEAWLFHKNDDGLARVAQFVAVAVAAYALAPVVERRASWLWRLGSLLGRNSLVVFAGSAVMAGIGQVLDRQGVYGAIYDIAFAGAGVAIFVVLASLRERMRDSRRRPVSDEAAAQRRVRAPDALDQRDRAQGDRAQGDRAAA